MTYQVTFTPQTKKSLRKLDRPSRARIQAAIDLFAETPRPPSATQLVNGNGAWRVRTGNFRIIYDIHDQELTILVLKVGHRLDMYNKTLSGH